MTGTLCYQGQEGGEREDGEMPATIYHNGPHMLAGWVTWHRLQAPAGDGLLERHQNQTRQIHNTTALALARPYSVRSIMECWQKIGWHLGQLGQVCSNMAHTSDCVLVTRLTPPVVHPWPRRAEALDRSWATPVSCQSDRETQQSWVGMYYCRKCRSPTTPPAPPPPSRRQDGPRVENGAVL